MILNKLSISYKCQSSIGNSLKLDEMVKEVLNNFFRRNRCYARKFYLVTNELSQYINSIGKKVDYEIEELLKKSTKDKINIFKYKDSLNLIFSSRLEKSFFIFIYDESVDVNFIKLIFESLRKTRY